MTRCLGGRINELLMTSRNTPAFATVLLAVFTCSGCRLPGGDSVPHIKGRWTGRVVPVTVYDDFGGVYNAAALQVDGGPGYARSPGGRSRPASEPLRRRIGPVTAEMGAGELPLLVDGGEGIPTVIPAATLPMGKRIEVHGRMAKYIVLTPEGLQPPRTTGVSRIRPSRPETTGIEHVLVVSGGPRVLGE